MVALLPPDASTTFIAAVLVPALLGFIVGIVAKLALKIAAAIAVVIIVLIVIGFIQPNQVIQPIVALIRSGPSLISKVDQIAGYLPYSSITFIVGFVVGFFKG
jgi:uncharacterized membrane protein (Fun14 family)